MQTTRQKENSVTIKAFPSGRAATVTVSGSRDSEGKRMAGSEFQVASTHWTSSVTQRAQPLAVAPTRFSPPAQLYNCSQQMTTELHRPRCFGREHDENSTILDTLDECEFRSKRNVANKKKPEIIAFYSDQLFLLAAGLARRCNH